MWEAPCKALFLHCFQSPFPPLETTGYKHPGRVKAPTSWQSSFRLFKS